MTTKLAKHTPGPWTVSARGRFIRYGGVHGPNICDLEVFVGEVDEDRANARLIAAAPALLEALKACLGVLDMECPTCDGCTTDPCSQCLGKAAIRAAVGAQEENTK